MGHLRFEWDARKNSKNRKKHGVTFAEARSVFFDEYAVEFYDDRHSVLEDRFLLLGMSFRTRLLLVVYAPEENGSILRIISARKATANERREYRREQP